MKGIFALLLIFGSTLFYFCALQKYPSSNNILATYPDAFQFLWNIWWLKERVAEFGNSIHYSDYIFWPFGSRLYLHTLTEGLLLPAAILLKDFTIADIFNLVIIFCFVTNGISAYALFYIFSKNFWLSLVLSLAFSFHPFFLGHLEGGHLNFLGFFPAPLAIAAALSVSGKKILFLLAATLVGYLTVINLYYFYFIALFGILTALVLVLSAPFVAQKEKKIFYSLGIRFTLIIVLAMLFASPYLINVSKDTLSGNFQENHSAEIHSARLINFIEREKLYFFSKPRQAIAGSASELNSAERGLYIGFSLLILVGSLLWRSKSSQTLYLFSSSLMFFILALGPIIKLSGNVFFTNYIWQLFAEHLPFFPSVPARLAIFGELLLMLTICRLAREISLKKNYLIFWLFLILIEFFPQKSPTMQLPISPLLNNIKELKLDALYDISSSQDLALLNQTVHETPIVHGNISRKPKAALAFYRKNKFIKYLDGKISFLEGAIFKDYKALAIEGLIVSSVDEKRLELAGQIPWLQAKYQDNLITLFVEKG
ncbi:MAG TPA: hypothetical protein PKD37_02980 [Oligoflexia bacterium]|nr:hypothetical protein [Oligoflexia bacterium]HMP26931.1 hypothetical protein [Oligoflexia bacterium]